MAYGLRGYSPSWSWGSKVWKYEVLLLNLGIKPVPHVMLSHSSVFNGGEQKKEIYS